jgi:hypothetical protein
VRRILSVRHARFSRQEGGLIATADLLASSSNSALGFEDSELGNQVLDSMRVHPRIRSTVLYKETGQIFAWYVRTDLTGGYLPPRHPAEGVNWATSFLSFSERVFLEGKPVGKIYLEEDLNDVNSRRIHFAWVTAMMALGCMTLVYLLSWRLRRIIAQPILQLADIARNVASANAKSALRQKLSWEWVPGGLDVPNADVGDPPARAVPEEFEAVDGTAFDRSRRGRCMFRGAQ